MSLELASGAMAWTDYDFIRDSPEPEREEPVHRTGWETVIFNLDEEEPQADAEDHRGLGDG